MSGVGATAGSSLCGVKPSEGVGDVNGDRDDHVGDVVAAAMELRECPRYGGHERPCDRLAPSEEVVTQCAGYQGEEDIVDRIAEPLLDQAKVVQ